jgi:hypothetical protein
LWELAGLFLKLGTIAFGGPAAHIAMMEDEVNSSSCWWLARLSLSFDISESAQNSTPHPSGLFSFRFH